MISNRVITLKHLLIDGKKMIGLKFYPDKVIHTLVKELPSARWSEDYGMVYILNTKDNLDLIFQKFKGVCWINAQHFIPNRKRSRNNEAPNVDHYATRKLPLDYRRCPPEYLQKLKIRQYAPNTVKVYVTMFESFINYYKYRELSELDENDIRDYLEKLINEKRSSSYLNQAVNSIKFYYEVVMEMPNRFYSIERPRQEHKLPKVISKEEVKEMIGRTYNPKHRCIISLLYSAGLRRGELLNLKLTDIDSKRMQIIVRGAKGNKERITVLGKNVLDELRQYAREYRPKEYLFEGPKGGRYSAESVVTIVKRAAVRAGDQEKSDASYAAP